MMDRIVTSWWRAFTSPRLYRLVAESRRVIMTDEERDEAYRKWVGWRDYVRYRDWGREASGSGERDACTESKIEETPR